MERAAQQLLRLSGTKLFPLKFSWLYPLLGILILVNLFIAMEIRNPSPIGPVLFSSNAIRSIDAYLHEQRARKKKPSEGAGSTIQNKIYNDLENLSQNMKRPSASRDDLAGSINKMLKEIESGQAIVAKELGEQLKLHNIEEIPVQAVQQFEKWSLTNIKQLQEMVDRMFDHQVPETISERLSILNEQQQLKEVLDHLLGNVDDPDSRGNNENPMNPGNRGKRSGSGSGLNGADDMNQKASGNQSFPATDRGDGDPDESDRSEDGADGGGGGPGDEAGGDDAVSPTAGKGRADGSRKSQAPMDSAKGGALQDRSLPSSKDYYRAHIRALTAIGQAKLENQKVIREYQKEVEGILQKEEIPLNYRTYIRNYFLSIGMRKEK